jgi:hypothetical protein
MGLNKSKIYNKKDEEKILLKNLDTRLLPGDPNALSEKKILDTGSLPGDPNSLSDAQNTVLSYNNYKNLNRDNTDYTLLFNVNKKIDLLYNKKIQVDPSRDILFSISESDFRIDSDSYYILASALYKKLIKHGYVNAKFIPLAEYPNRVIYINIDINNLALLINKSSIS